jgi:hypothetical protein
MGQEWFKNENVNAYYKFLGVCYFLWMYAEVGKT